jgi:hypothetical protein
MIGLFVISMLRMMLRGSIEVRVIILYWDFNSKIETQKALHSKLS